MPAYVDKMRTVLAKYRAVSRKEQSYFVQGSMDGQGATVSRIDWGILEDGREAHGRRFFSTGPTEHMAAGSTTYKDDH